MLSGRGVDLAQLSGQPPQELTDGDGAHSSFWLRDGNQVCTAEHRRHHLARLAIGQKRNHCSQVLVKDGYIVPCMHASRRCCTRRPEGPGADAAGKLRRAFATMSGSTNWPGHSTWNGGTAGLGWVGCSCWSAVMVAGISAHRPSARRAARALLSKPSRAKPVASSLRWLAVRSRPLGGRGGQRLSQRPALSPSTVLAATALACLRPPRCGTSRTACGSMSSSCQALVSL